MNIVAAVLPEQITDVINIKKTISFVDVIDIACVSVLLYYLYKFIRDKRAGKLAVGVLLLFVIQIISKMLDMYLMQYIMQNIFQIGFITLVILFQPEIRSVLEKVGTTPIKGLRSISETKDQSYREKVIDEIVSAVGDMGDSKTGALIVFERRERLGEIISTGTMVDAAPSAELIKNIFFKNSPLHDGAMIVRAGRVCAAGCVLPLSGNQSLSRDLGTRHRAAVGMSESADSVLVVVSEETGSISVAIGGMLKRHLSPDMLRKLLENELLDSEKQEKSRLAAIRDMWKGGAGK